MEKIAAKSNDLGGFWPSNLQPWREIAHVKGRMKFVDDSLLAACHGSGVAGSSSNWPATYCQYRYPSPRRSGPLRVRPTSLPNANVGDLCRSSRAAQKSLVFEWQRADSAPYKTKQKKGSYLCNLSVLSSLLRPSGLLAHVWTTILNAGLRAPQRVQSSLTAQAVMPSRVPSLVAQPVRFATKLRGSVAKTNALSGAQHHLNRRTGRPCAAVFCLNSEYRPKSLGAHNV